MIILALDTTTRAGSVALVRDEALVAIDHGDPARTHGERLPGELLALLDRHGLAIRDVDLYAVAAGPGSFTGLRIGIACVQGLALANDRRVVPVSALDALARVARRTAGRDARRVAAWMDAQRGQVFAAQYDEQASAPRVDEPAAIAAEWARGAAPTPEVIIGDGALRYAEVVRAACGARVEILPPAPLAGEIGLVAHARRHDAVSPAAIRPIYIRRPDAELARERVAGPRA